MPQDRRRAWARAVLVLAALATLLVVAAPAALAQTQPTDPGQTQPADPGQERCDTIPNTVARNVCKAGTNPGQVVTGAVAGAAQNVVQTAGDSALRSFTAAVAAAGQFFLEKVGGLIQGTTSPDVVSADWFASQYRVMMALAVLIALPILLVSVAQAIVRADGMQAIRSAFVFLPLAATLSAVGPAMAQMLINVTDWMSAALGGNAAADAQ
jgi:hypothetical protein